MRAGPLFCVFTTFEPRVKIWYRSEFLSEILHFMVVKFSVNLNRLVFLCLLL